MRFGHGELHLFVMALLAQRPMHGYELMSEMQKRLGRRYKASPGSIYPALQALESEGLISATDDGDRRVYELTAEGADACTKRAPRIAAMEERLGISIASGLDVVLARLTLQVFAAAPRVEQERIERVLEAASMEIEAMAKGVER